MTITGNGGPQLGPQAQQNAPQLNVLGQYIKDFSFENPNAPRSLAPSQTQPAINIQINVNASPMSETDFEVTLKLEGKADQSRHHAVRVRPDLRGRVPHPERAAGARRSRW